jgi:hypothetical protein
LCCVFHIPEESPKYGKYPALKVRDFSLSNPVPHFYFTDMKTQAQKSVDLLKDSLSFVELGSE